MTKTEQYILTRLDNLEKAFLTSQKNGVPVTEKADAVPVVQIRVNDLDESVTENTQGIEDCNTGLIETYEVAESNTSEIEDCNNALMELYEMIGE